MFFPDKAKAFSEARRMETLAQRFGQGAVDGKIQAHIITIAI